MFILVNLSEACLVFVVIQEVLEQKATIRSVIRRSEDTCATHAASISLRKASRPS